MTIEIVNGGDKVGIIIPKDQLALLTVLIGDTSATSRIKLWREDKIDIYDHWPDETVKSITENTSENLSNTFEELNDFLRDHG